MRKNVPMPSRLMLCVIFSAAVGGCLGRAASHPELVEANGTVTVHGKPVQNITVSFYPAAGGRASRGSTDAEGKFRLMYDRGVPGAVPGEYSVKFMLMDADAPANMLPRKYADQTASMSADVTQEGPNEFTFDLKGK
ncbi:carboxypeptidase-like regulatory domain-containing protein [Blastopirellula sp. J2-11]|uniref:carboxypeptidase-like regulatory domain-containing protein n=1 Tax=Blastopirellula sp. J2-11 TaxID=2943192 RepID=UPI0021C624CC|nr:carboxypeptidase-like regulatory domain-containing protein [Blastopirellula sp. J2-11]UUO05905.1 carboxypeptidase-like regulatory domain-containing protein [Blastopirellula sp. J2-11]